MLPFAVRRRTLLSNPSLSLPRTQSRVDISGNIPRFSRPGSDLRHEGDRDDPPAAYTLVDRVVSNSFADDHLMPSGMYYYHVAAVN
jgi:hypothetical protein